MKSVRIWSYSGSHFPAVGLNTERYSDKNNSEYRHFSRSVGDISRILSQLDKLIIEVFGNRAQQEMAFAYFEILPSNTHIILSSNETIRLFY